MNDMTLLCHFYNEEYLLPFWIRHHLPLFDRAILVNYNSTDSSKSIIKKLAPDWEIVDSRNEFFGAEEVDREIEDLERTVGGWTICLNTTEFLLCNDYPRYLVNEGHMAYGIQQYCVVGNGEPKNQEEFYSGLMNGSIKNGYGHRFMHKIKHVHGHWYEPGRHGLRYSPVFGTPNMFIAHCRFYPWNEKFIKRKLQIASRIPQKDIDRKFGFQHMWTREEMEREKAMVTPNVKCLWMEYDSFVRFGKFAKQFYV